MNPIVNLKTLPERLRSLGQRVIVAVASPADAHTEEVIERSVCEGFADFILTAVEGKQDIAEQLAARHDALYHLLRRKQRRINCSMDTQCSTTIQHLR